MLLQQVTLQRIQITFQLLRLLLTLLLQFTATMARVLQYQHLVETRITIGRMAKGMMPDM